MNEQSSPRIFIVMGAFATLLNMTGCSETPQPTQQTEQPAQIVDTVKEATTPLFFNDSLHQYAQVLAGLDTQFYNKNEVYQRYKTSANEAYETFYSTKISPFEKWRSSSLDSTKSGRGSVFYPFSGPDIVYAYSLYPNAADYFLFGLEPIGVIPQWTASERDSMVNNLATLQHALSDQMKFSFFVTTHMSSDLNQQNANGVLPVLLFYMARLNLRVVDIKHIAISDNGTLIDGESEIGKGLQIIFTKGNEQILQRLNYFSTDISNPGYEKCKGLEALISAIDKSDVLIKSASYCLHEEKYNRIRTQILKHANSIVQDDTGVPYNYFQENEWYFKFFGSYQSPIPVFKQFYQKEFHQKFREQGIPIDFRFGYSNPSNILVVNRK